MTTGRINQITCEMYAGTGGRSPRTRVTKTQFLTSTPTQSTHFPLRQNNFVRLLELVRRTESKVHQDTIQLALIGYPQLKRRQTCRYKSSLFGPITRLSRRRTPTPKSSPYERHLAVTQLADTQSNQTFCFSPPSEDQGTRQVVALSKENLLQQAATLIVGAFKTITSSLVDGLKNITRKSCTVERIVDFGNSQIQIGEKINKNTTINLISTSSI